MKKLIVTLAISLLFGIQSFGQVYANMDLRKKATEAPEEKK